MALERAGLATLVESRPTKGYVEKFYAASAHAYAVDLMVLPDEAESDLIVVVGSDDLALDLLAAEMRDDESAPDLLTIRLGSLEGLIALRHGLGHAAGCHLIDGETGEANAPYARRLFPGRDLVLITLVRRQQCLLVAPGNPLALESLADVARAGARFVNRNRGSGTRVWIDRELAARSIRPADLRRLRRRGQRSPRGGAGRGRGPRRRGRRRCAPPAAGSGSRRCRSSTSSTTSSRRARSSNRPCCARSWSTSSRSASARRSRSWRGTTPA